MSTGLRGRAIRILAAHGIALLLVLSAVSPSPAAMALIETTAPLSEHTEEAVQTAVGQAVRTAARGAAAMGLPWIQLRQAFVGDDMVLVQVLATDTRPEAEANLEPEPGVAPDAEPGSSGKLHL